MGKGVQLYIKPKSEGTNSLDPRRRGQEDNESVETTIIEQF